MHTTGTTTPDGVHQLAPGLGERRFMPPPSGGHFKLPAELQAAQTAQTPQAPMTETGSAPRPLGAPVHTFVQNDGTRIPLAEHVHAVNLEGAMHMQGLPAAVQQVVGSLTPAETQALQERMPDLSAGVQALVAQKHQATAAVGAPLQMRQAPPAPAGYQSTPMSVPPGMVPHTVQHAAPQGLSGMQPQGFMVVNTPGGFQPAPPTTTTNTTSWPRPLGSMEVAPPTHTHPAPSAPWPPAQPHPLTPIPSTYPADAMPSVQPPHVHQRATLTPGTVLRLEGPQDVIEAAIGMLMLRGLHVTVLPS